MNSENYAENLDQAIELCDQVTKLLATVNNLEADEPLRVLTEGVTGRQLARIMAEAHTLKVKIEVFKQKAQLLAPDVWALIK